LRQKTGKALNHPKPKTMGWLLGIPLEVPLGYTLGYTPMVNPGGSGYPATGPRVGELNQNSNSNSFSRFIVKGVHHHVT